MLLRPAHCHNHLSAWWLLVQLFIKTVSFCVSDALVVHTFSVAQLSFSLSLHCCLLSTLQQQHCCYVISFTCVCECTYFLSHCVHHLVQSNQSKSITLAVSINTVLCSRITTLFFQRINSAKKTRNHCIQQQIQLMANGLSAKFIPLQSGSFYLITWCQCQSLRK